MSVLTMRRGLAALRRLLRCERGATAIEYALIAGGIAVVIIGAVMSLGETVQASFQSVVDGLAEL